MMFMYLALIDSVEDKSKFELLYYEYRERMFFAAEEIVKNKQDAEDAVHNAFIGIANNIEKIDSPYSDATLSYVIKASKNSAISIYNKNKKNAHNKLDENIYVTDEEFFDSVFLKSTYDEVVNAILNLDDTYKIPMYYYYVKEMKIKDVAKMLGINLSTAKSRIYSGKRELLKQLGVSADE